MPRLNFITTPPALPFQTRAHRAINATACIPSQIKEYTRATPARLALRATAAPTSSESGAAAPKQEAGDGKKENQPTKAPHEFKFLQWADVEQLASSVANQARPESFNLVLAITRGGLVPAALICEALQLRTVLSTTVMFYTDSGEPFFGMTEPRFLSFPSPDALEGRRVLIVDDVWDTGNTACAVRKRVLRANPKCVKVAVLHFKKAASEQQRCPEFYGALVNDWVVYPWERASPSAPSCSPDPLVEADQSSPSSPPLLHNKPST